MDQKYTEYGTPENEGQLSFIEEMKECSKRLYELFLGCLALAFLVGSIYVMYLFYLGAAKVVIKEAPRDVQVKAYEIREVVRDFKSAIVTGKRRTDDQILNDRISDFTKGEIPK